MSVLTMLLQVLGKSYTYQLWHQNVVGQILLTLQKLVCIQRYSVLLFWIKFVIIKQNEKPSPYITTKVWGVQCGLIKGMGTSHEKRQILAITEILHSGVELWTYLS